VYFLGDIEDTYAHEAMASGVPLHPIVDRSTTGPNSV
jgi:hypothetical protein